ncbi:MAG: DUF371 domain-containing protein [Candidatus Thorarchaeota archaeon]
MHTVRFGASGHENVIGEHGTTVEITSEANLTRKGTCIIAVRAEKTLATLDSTTKALAASRKTIIVLRLNVGNQTEEIRGRGDPGLTYSDSVSMVARKSSFVCGRTLMVRADKSASDLSRSFIERLRHSDAVVECELLFVSE